MVLKRAKFFVTCQGKVSEGVVIDPDTVLRGLLSKNDLQMLPAAAGEQLAFTDVPDMVRVMGGAPVSAFGYLPEERVMQNAGKYEFGIHI